MCYEAAKLYPLIKINSCDSYGAQVSTDTIYILVVTPGSMVISVDGTDNQDVK